MIAIDSLGIFQNFPIVFPLFFERVRPARAIDDDFDVRTRCDRMPAIAEPQPQPSLAAHSAQQRAAAASADASSAASAVGAHLRSDVNDADWQKLQFSAS